MSNIEYEHYLGNISSSQWLDRRLLFSIFAKGFRLIGFTLRARLLIRLPKRSMAWTRFDGAGMAGRRTTAHEEQIGAVRVLRTQ